MQGRELSQFIRQEPVPAGQVRVHWLGNSSFAFRFSGGQVVYVDPHLSPDCVQRLNGWERLRPPLMRPEEVDADLVVITHPHWDHLDPDTIPGVAAATRALFLGPASCCAGLAEMGVPQDRIRRLDQDGQAEVAGLTISGVRAWHVHPARPCPDAIGAHISDGAVTVYHAGDSEWNLMVQESLQRLPQPQIMCLPISGRLCIMNPLDAALFAKAIGPRALIPMHYGLYWENTADPLELLFHMRKRQVEGVSLVQLPYGGHATLPA